MYLKCARGAFSSHLHLATPGVLEHCKELQPTGTRMRATWDERGRYADVMTIVPNEPSALTMSV